MRPLKWHQLSFVETGKDVLMIVFHLFLFIIAGGRGGEISDRSQYLDEKKSMYKM